MLGPIVAGVCLYGAGSRIVGGTARRADRGRGSNRIVKAEDQWRRELTQEQYRVLRLKGTEAPFTGRFWDSREAGAYLCAGCGQELFASTAKFDAGCGWPSFWEAADPSKVEFRADSSHGMQRVEVVCSRCGGHLGHVFDDGPKPTGKRYCINSASLEFRPSGR
jgi:peptide-methionine (R)-S-oxide reductase